MHDTMLKIVKENDLKVRKCYSYQDGKVVRNYGFDNYKEDYFKDFEMPLEEIAQTVYDLMELNYSQENEFFID